MRKIIGKSLEAKVTIYPNEQVGALLTALDADLAQLLIVSPDSFSISKEAAPENAMTFEDVAILVEKLKGKCVIVVVKYVRQLVKMKNFQIYVLHVRISLKKIIQRQ